MLAFLALVAGLFAEKRDMEIGFKDNPIKLNRCLANPDRFDEEALFGLQISDSFVDIVPKIGRLKLCLNMKFSEINDPYGICRDVSGVGIWGNGEVELVMSSIDLIGQSLAKQQA